MRDNHNEWVSIADLMAGVVGVVILLFVIMAVQRADAAAAGEGRGPQAVRRQVITAIASDLQSQLGDYDVIVGDDVISLPSEGMFEPGQITLTDRGSEIAAALLRSTAAVLPCYSRHGRLGERVDAKSKGRGAAAITQCAGQRPIFAAVLIEGHADSNTGGPGCDNWCLSTARARSVFDLARKKEPELLKLRNADDQPLFGLAGYGDTRPLKDHTIPTTDARQRRVEIHFILDPSSVEAARKTSPATGE